jgi:hypothetical protein
MSTYGAKKLQSWSLSRPGRLIIWRKSCLSPLKRRLVELWSLSGCFGQRRNLPLLPPTKSRFFVRPAHTQSV